MLKVVWNVIKKIFSIVFTILSPLKRLVCRRKRRNSDTILPLTNHYPSVENLSSNGITPVQEELSPWDTWEDESNKIRSVQQYRQQQQQQLQQLSQEPEPEVDYFSDMTPALKKQKKVLIKKQEETINKNAISNKLAVSSDIPLMQTSELGAWEDDGNAWEAEESEDLSWEAENVIREKRRLERQQRHLEQQRKKQEREQQKLGRVGGQGHLSAVRLS